MSKPTRPREVILVASDSTTEAELVQKLLNDDFENVFTSTDPNVAAVDFDRHRPDVLVLAFGSIEKSERHNLGLYRHCKEIHRQPHRTIILCNNNEVLRAYELCRDEIFDDYVLFWPLAYDASRLPMAVHHALRELAANKEDGPRPMEFATQVRHLAEFEILLKQRMAQGDEHIELTGRAIAQAEQEIATALAGFSQSLAQGELSNQVEVRSARVLQQAFDHLTHESIEAPLHAVADMVQPLREWSDKFRQASAPHLESIRSLHALAECVQPTVMVVDDDEFQHKIVSRLVKDEGYRMVFASSGIEALNMLRKIQPDLILLDLSMPDMDGLEVTRRVKGVARFAQIPIIMITGNSEESIVTDSMNAGAIDFMVKPLGREALIAKIAKVLGTKDTSPSEPPPPRG
ncbi:MAG: response regulator [Holophaga sp.]